MYKLQWKQWRFKSGNSFPCYFVTNLQYPQMDETTEVLISSFLLKAHDVFLTIYVKLGNDSNSKERIQRLTKALVGFMVQTDLGPLSKNKPTNVFITCFTSQTSLFCLFRPSAAYLQVPEWPPPPWWRWGVAWPHWRSAETAGQQPAARPTRPFR